jgi:hypothetical protein
MADDDDLDLSKYTPGEAANARFSREATHLEVNILRGIFHFKVGSTGGGPGHKLLTVVIAAVVMALVVLAICVATHAPSPAPWVAPLAALPVVMAIGLFVTRRHRQRPTGAGKAAL